MNNDGDGELQLSAPPPLATDTIGEGGHPREQGLTSKPEDDSTFSDLNLDGGTPVQLPIPVPPSCALTLRDPSIRCDCPVRALRQVSDLAFAGMGENGPEFLHLLCHPNVSLLSTGVAFDTGSFIKSVAAVGADHLTDAEKMFMAMLGRNPSLEQRAAVKNFTSVFYCDGPCRGSKHIMDYVLCKKCCAWQHKRCMLYGDVETSGGPVCNRCYIDFIVFHEQIVKAQRKRLVMAAKQAFQYLDDPANTHHTQQRAWCRKFLARFMEHHQAHYHRWVASRRLQSTAPLARLPTQAAPSTQLRSCGTMTGKTDNKRVLRKRKAPVVPLQHSQMDLESDQQGQEEGWRDSSELAVGNDEGHEYVASDDDLEISQASLKKRKLATKAALPSNTTKLLPLRAASKKLSRKRKVRNAANLMPGGSESQTRSSRAPRKSVRKPAQGEVLSDQEDSEDEQPVTKKSRGAKSGYKMSCKCAVPTSPQDSFECQSCDLRQHTDCAEDNQDSLPILCNFCFNRSPSEDSSQPAATQPRKPNPSVPRPNPLQKSPPQTLTQSPEEFAAAIHDEVDQICTVILWKEYCNIPDPSDEPSPPGSPSFGSEKARLPGQNPSRYPPAQWLEEMQSCARKLLDAAGQQQVKIFLVPALSAFPRQSHHILKALREIAIEQLFRGSYKGKRKELGVLAEVLGLEEKGTYWKAGVA